MHIAVVSIFPEMCRALCAQGVVARAIDAGTLGFSAVDLRDFAADRHATVDDRPFGGGPGMVMMAPPLQQAVEAGRDLAPGAPSVLLSPQGKRLDQRMAGELAKLPGLVLIAGRYEGVDQRFIESQVDMELSIGDYVLSGGELAAMVVVDAVARLLPGTLGNPESVVGESFMTGLLDYPHFTRPQTHDDRSVPEVLLSGDHGAIARWRHKQALRSTWEKRPDLLALRNLDIEERQLLDEVIHDLEAS